VEALRKWMAVVGRMGEEKGQIKDLIHAHRIEVGNERYAKTHFILHGEGIIDNNKLLAIPYDVAKLTRADHPVLDRLIEVGYKNIGWINLEELPKAYQIKSNEDLPFITNGWMGMGPAGFEGLALSRYSEENPQKRSETSAHNLYLVKLSLGDPSLKKVKKRVKEEESRGWPAWDWYNIRRRDIWSVIAVDPTIEPKFEDLAGCMETSTYSGLIASEELEGEYSVSRVGKLETIPSRLFDPLSIVKHREGSQFNSVDHYRGTHIDLGHLSATWGVGYELAEVESWVK